MKGHRGYHLKTPPPNVEAVAPAMAVATSIAVAMVCNTGRLATGTTVRLQGQRQTDFNSCVAAVAKHDRPGL